MTRRASSGPKASRRSNCGIVNLKQGDAAADAACESLYAALTAKGLEPLYDDRAERAGAKFATMDLIGLPWRNYRGAARAGKGCGGTDLAPHGRERRECRQKAAVDRIAQIYS